MYKRSSLHFNNTQKQACLDVYKYIFRNALIQFISFEIFLSEKQMSFLSVL